MQKDFQPLVSIVIPVYNGSNYMREAIESALAQTYPNIEIIVVNDGSTDDTDVIAQSYGNKIRYFSKENGGVSTALNLAIENMRGEYFSWLSHDDAYLPKKIENQINILRTLHDKTTVIYSGYKEIDEKRTTLQEIRLEKKYQIMDLNKPLFSLFKGLISGCTLLIHISHFKKIGLFDISLKTTQDYDLWFKILRNSAIFYDSSCNTLSRVHSEQVGITNSQHEKNCCELWKFFIVSITEEEMIHNFKSPLNFYQLMLFQYFSLSYSEVVQILYNKYKKEYAKSKKNWRSIIIHYKIKNNYAYYTKQLKIQDYIPFLIFGRYFLKKIIADKVKIFFNKKAVNKS